MDTIDRLHKITRPLPSRTAVFKALFSADLKVQWRNRRALILTIILPVFFIITWKDLIPLIGLNAVLATCIAVGLPATGLMAYTQTLARDRERGVFQRLRAAPISTSAIMLSRIAVQLIVVVVMTLLTYLVGHFADGIDIPGIAILLMIVVSAVCGAVYLALGQLVVASFKSSDTVNAAARLVYLPIALVGALGEIGIFGDVVKKVVVWSPFGTTQTLISWSLAPSLGDIHVFYALLVTLGYICIFATLGIRRFKWASE